MRRFRGQRRWESRLGRVCCRRPGRGRPGAVLRRFGWRLSRCFERLMYQEGYSFILMLYAISRLTVSEKSWLPRGNAETMMMTTESVTTVRMIIMQYQSGSAPYFIGVAFGAHHSLAVHVVLRLIVQDAESTHPRVRVGVRAVLSCLISPVFRHHYFVDGPQNVHLQLPISPRRCG